MNRRYFRRIGFTLIEIVVAVSLFVIGLIGVFAVLPAVLKSSRRAAISTQVALHARRVLAEAKLKGYDNLTKQCGLTDRKCDLDDRKGDFFWNVTACSGEPSRVRIEIKWQEDGREKQEEFYTYIGNFSF